jgi:uncharacterized protein
MHIIIDGYNLIRQSASLRVHERRGLDEGRNELIKRLSIYHRDRKHRITIIFDGWQGGSIQEERDRYGAIEIIYSKLGEKADDVIKRIVQTNRGEDIVVVTSDRDIASFVTHRGKVVISAQEFEDKMSKPAAVTMKETIDNDDEPDRKNTRKKGPSRKLSKSKRESLIKTSKL